MRRFRTAVLAALLAVAMLTGAAWATSPATSTPHGALAATTIWHPYSTPSWYPLHDGIAQMDCAYSNPDCPVEHRHKDHAITFLTKSKPDPKYYYHAPVYAAGAGFAHIGHSGIKSCHPVSGQPLGNWVWINHGAGVISRYAHLTNIQVTEGDHVTPQTIIGYSSNSGESVASCYIYYLNFQIQHDAVGPFGVGYPLATSKACMKRHNKTVVTDPNYHLNHKTWNEVPKGTWIGYYGHACVTAPVPNTPSRPAPPTVRPGSGTLTVSWSRPTSGPKLTQIDVDLQKSVGGDSYKYASPAHKWLAATSTSHEYTGLTSGLKYRVRLAFKSRAGWSLESNWTPVTVN